jgi:AbrB family looped-hinge helix DNA binding protein
MCSDTKFNFCSATDFRRRIGAKGQVVIPKNVRDFLNIESGSDVVFEVKDDAAILRPSKSQLVEDYLHEDSSTMKGRAE